MRNVSIVLFVCVVVASGQVIWTERARVADHTEFFSQLMQETIYELERQGFSTLTLSNITQEIDLRIYRWHVNGTAVYFNGFVVSIQKIDVTGMSQQVNMPTIDGVQTPRAVVMGTLNLREVKLGYDVTFTPFNYPVQTYTGDFTHSLITWAISVAKNLLTNEITVSMSSGISGGLIRMVYRPHNNVTEVMSRSFLPSHNADGIRTWATILSPIILNVIRDKIPFPAVCYSHC